MINVVVYIQPQKIRPNYNNNNTALNSIIKIGKMS